MSTPRRDFLGWLGASALLGAAASPLSASTSESRLPRALDSKFDMSWTDRVTGKYRAVFDSPEVSEGAALFRAAMWQDQHKAVYGTDPKEMTSVAVFRHKGISLVMSDAYWERFEVGKANKLKDDKGKKWAKANPIRAAAPGTPPQRARYNIEGFIASGGIVLACNLAFANVVDHYTKAEKVSKEEARKLALVQLLPGVILQPSGVFAALRAQESGCHYILAS